MTQKDGKQKSADHAAAPSTASIIILVVTLIAQVAAGYGLFYFARVLWVSPDIVDKRGFIAILLSMAGCFTLAAWGVGMLGAALRKQKPAYPWSRLVTSFVGALVPVLILAYLGWTIGFDDTKNFQNIVVGRMVPYYTNLTMVFSIAGFYVKEWFSRVVKPRNPKQK